MQIKRVQKELERQRRFEEFEKGTGQSAMSREKILVKIYPFQGWNTLKEESYYFKFAI